MSVAEASPSSPPSPPSRSCSPLFEIVTHEISDQIESRGRDAGPVIEEIEKPPLKIPRGPADPDRARAGALGMSIETFKQLTLMGFPIACFNILHHISLTMSPMHKDLDCVEYFSGVGNISRVFRQGGVLTATFDYIKNIEFENLCSPGGMMTALYFAMMLKARGLASWATVCSSWIFLSASCTGRPRSLPWGALPGPGITVATADGNTMAA